MTEAEMNEQSAFLDMHDSFFHDHVLEVDGLFHIHEKASDILGVNYNRWYIDDLWNNYWKDYKFKFAS